MIIPEKLKPIPTTCFSCPYMQESVGGQTVGCRVAMKKIDDMDIKPDWCPLPETGK